MSSINPNQERTIYDKHEMGHSGCRLKFPYNMYRQ